MKSLIVLSFLLFFSCSSKKTESNYTYDESDKNFIIEFIPKSKYIEAIVFSKNRNMDIIIVDEIELNDSTKLLADKNITNYKKEWKSISAAEVADIVTHELEKTDTFKVFVQFQSENKYNMYFK